MPQKEDNRTNNNVHPNSRAARGDEAIEAERAARAAAAPAPEPAEDTATQLESLNKQVEDQTSRIADLEEANEQLEQDVKDAQEAQKKAQEAEAKAQEAAGAAIKRADNLEAQVKDLTDQLAEAKKPAPDNAKTEVTTTQSGDQAPGSNANDKPAAPLDGPNVPPAPAA